MVTTRASSRESTPSVSARDTTYSERLRTSARRSTTATTDGGTPSGKSRAKKSGPTAAARTGHTSHAYGVAAHAASSRAAARNQQGFSSALDDILVEQEQEPELTTALSPVAEEERHSTPASTPASNPSSSSSASPTFAAINGKSFSVKREQGLTNNPGPLPVARDFPEHLIMEPTAFERLGAAAFDFVTGTKIFFNDYWELILGLILALSFGSLLAIFGVPAIGRLFQPPVDPVSSPAITTTVVSYLSKPSDRAMTSRLNHLESRVSFLEDELARSRAANAFIHPPFNHISASIGATILPSVTSPTKRTYSSWLLPFSKLWTPPGMKGPLTALQPWSEPGECWCTPADRAALGVRAPYPVKAGAVTIEHVLLDDLAGSGVDTEAAPKIVEVWARAGGREEEKGECLGAAPEKGKGWSCLGRLEIAHHVRDVRSWIMDLTVGYVVATDFTFVVLENSGNKEATCLYRVQLHGERV